MDMCEFDMDIMDDVSMDLEESVDAIEFDGVGILDVSDIDTSRFDEISDNTDSSDIWDMSDEELEQAVVDYESMQERQAQEDLFNDLTDGLSIDQLKDLKSGLESRDETTLEYFGIREDSDVGDDDDEYVKVLKR